MIEQIKNIEIGVGVGKVKFGMLKTDVLSILGMPTDKEVEKDFETGDAVETWDYDNCGIAFSFDEEEDWRLETITINSSYFELNGVGLVGKGIEEVQDFIEKHELGDMEFEDYSTPENPNHELIDVDEANMFFWFTDNILQEIQFGVQWDEDDNALWPE
ncbi:hypothetical protein [Wenyingzhuangia marina]|uniref:Uncharacterized protein n=1 Tax=Wenyingzhuangia marina TaxID=1195760 RepID=A0A1M5U050_9FLAO|nr:hypothetical protein [Wenyingzhuangia marina]GGF70357.1 hypothetical protein GCM10011397_11590 [Wenyingzhuangia marina]SHH56023.1 hypothetical protein SAMN05444281_0936 [Wenyingzhuangia marina]